MHDENLTTFEKANGDLKDAIALLNSIDSPRLKDELYERIILRSLALIIDLLLYIAKK
jgi:hypothetical protein